MRIPINKMRIEADEIKARQKARKETGVPSKVSLGEIYQMGMDILENQARIENKLNELLSRR